MATGGDWEAYWKDVAGLDDRFFRAEAEDYLRNLETVVPLSSTSRVLDWGCGFGLVAQLLAPRAGKIVLWDSSAAMRRHARARVEGWRHVGIIEPPPDWTRQGSFDLILANSVAQYVPVHEFARWLSLWRSLLAPGGRIVVSDLIPPRHSLGHDAVSAVWFALRHGTPARATWAGLPRPRMFWRLVRTCPLSRIGAPELRRATVDAGLTARILPRNLTYRRGRLAAVLGAAEPVPSPRT